MNPALTYFFCDPPLVVSPDKMWAAEVASIVEFCTGQGVDVGSGTRTIHPGMVRVDCRPDTQPDHVADACHLPFTDGEFDFLFSGHTIEHVLDPIVALKEWLRVVKPGGHVCVVVPDTRFTGGMNTDPTPHIHEWGPREFLADVFGWEHHTQCWWEAKPECKWAEADVVQIGTACPQWSFSLVLRKR